MTVKVSFSAEQEARLKQRVEASGIEIEAFVQRAVEEKLALLEDLANTLKPIHEEIHGQGLGEHEIERLAEEARAEVFSKRNRNAQ